MCRQEDDVCFVSPFARLTGFLRLNPLLRQRQTCLWQRGSGVAFRYIGLRLFTGGSAFTWGGGARSAFRFQASVISTRSPFTASAAALALQLVRDSSASQRACQRAPPLPSQAFQDTNPAPRPRYSPGLQLKASDADSKDIFFPFSPSMSHGRCVCNFFTPGRDSCDDLLLLTNRLACHICQASSFVMALGRQKVSQAHLGGGSGTCNGWVTSRRLLLQVWAYTLCLDRFIAVESLCRCPCCCWLLFRFCFQGSVTRVVACKTEVENEWENILHICLAEPAQFLFPASTFYRIKTESGDTNTKK